MRDRDDFIENLKEVRTHLLILTEDIKYPLPEERQRLLDGANLLIEHLLNMEIKDDIEAILRNIGKGQTAEAEKDRADHA
jgi:hypothetical protein